MKFLWFLPIILGSTILALEDTDKISYYDAPDYYDDVDPYEEVKDRDSGYGGGIDATGGINPLAALIAPLAGLALLGM